MGYIPSFKGNITTMLNPSICYGFPMTTIAKNLEFLMKEKGLSQIGLAERAKLNDTAVRDIIKGRSKDPQMKTLKALAGALGCAVEDLFDENLVDKGRKQHMQPSGRRVDIQELNVRAGAGAGQIVQNDGNEVIGTWSLPPSSLASHVGDVSSLRIIQIYGDSNVPDMYPGDRVLVNISDTKPSPPGFFVVWDGMGLVVKRCEYIPNSDPPRVRLSSSNKAYQSYELTLEECQINGRVVGKWQWT